MRTKILSFDLLQNFIGQPGMPAAAEKPQIQKTLLRAAIQLELTDKQRQCVELYYFKGLTMQQIADLLDLNRSTVCKRLDRARQRLKKAISYGCMGQACGRD